MIPTRYQPTDDERKKAKSRCVQIGAAQSVIRGIYGAALEGIIEAEKKLLSDGGCVRAVPLDEDSAVRAGYDVASDFAIRFRDVTGALKDSADKFCSENIDWREVEKLRDIA